MKLPPRDVKDGGPLDWWVHAVKQRAEIRRLRAALREIIELKPEDMYHATENSTAAAIAKQALVEQSANK